MKLERLLLLLAFITLFLACKKSEDTKPIDTLAGSYNGVLELKDCALPQTTYLSVSDCKANITKQSDTKVQVKLSNAVLGELYAFEGEVSSDTTFSVAKFYADPDSLYGNGRFAGKLKITLTNGCTFFGEVATFIYTEN